MQLVGYRLTDKNGIALKEWGGVYGYCPGVPNPLVLPSGDQICGAEPGASYGEYTLSRWEMEKPIQTVFEGAEFLSRVTDAEYGAIISAARENVTIARWLDIFRLRGEIDVSGTTANAAKLGLVQAGLLTAERADMIFAAA